MKKYYMAGNWKMHKTVSESVAMAEELKKVLAACPEKLLVAPAFTSLQAVATVLKGSNILLGAQNMGPEETGAHTGEVSVLMLKDLGVKAVILGHSERRHSYFENDELVNKKLLLALKHGLEPILCIGETLLERDSGKLEEVISRQLKDGLKNVKKPDLKQVTIAYEPVWAIGTGKTATPMDADAVHLYIRKLLAEMYSPEHSKAMCIQYGGSVKPENTRELMSMPNIDGALIGGASLNADSFVSIAMFRS